eukprot:m.58863 g.58863  ORF g.58863 m.58863 type:complete len:338 (+) comp12905_c1_seq1:54-1067(+)
MADGDDGDTDTLQQVCVAFFEAMQQFRYVIEQTSTTRRKKRDAGDGKIVWEPPEAPITRLYYDRSVKAEAANGTTMAAKPVIVFQDHADRQTFMQLLKSNMHCMWAAWEAFHHDLHHAAASELKVDPFGRQRHHDLANLKEALQTLAGGTCDGPAVNPFAFQLPLAKAGKTHRVEVCVLGLPGATLWLRFFYGLRNISGHGVPDKTLQNALGLFTDKGTWLNAKLAKAHPVGDLPDKPRIIAKIEELLKADNSCQLQGNPAVGMDDVAAWMAHKIHEFLKYRRQVHISTLLLETMHSFLMHVAPAVVGALVERTAKGQAREGLDWDCVRLFDKPAAP